MQMASGVNFPSNVEVKTITIDSIPASGNITVANPFGRADMESMVGIYFGGRNGNKCCAFIVNPAKGFSDNQYNRKIGSDGDYIYMTGYYSVESMTSESIVLRNTGTFNWNVGTYYLFAW